MGEKTDTGELNPKQQDEATEQEAVDKERIDESEDGSEELDDASTGEEILSVDGLREELQRIKSQAEEYLDGWQRARAEFANYKKRMVREQEQSRQRIAGSMLTKYFAVLDDLARALKERPADGDAAAWAEGIELIYRKMYAMLESEGVELIEADGEHFDPTVHEALSHEDSEQHEEGQIIEVIQPGYRMGDRVLRPAMVRVAK